MKKMKVTDISFELKVVGKPDGDDNRNVLLIDDKGFLCGIFANETLAQAAIPHIRSNILRGNLLGGYKQPKRYVHNSYKRM